MQAFILLVLVAAAAADVSHIVRSIDADAQVVKQDADVLPDKYQYIYETSNGIYGQASGQLKNISPDTQALVSEGSNSYTAPGGEVISVQYIADENGYQPTGAHLPTPPPPQAIPEYIVRAIEYIRTHPQPEEYVKKA